MVNRRIRHHLYRILSTNRIDALYNLFLYFYLYCHHCLFYKTCLHQQSLTATCHPNTRTKATCPPNPDTTQRDESLSRNRVYYQSGEMREFSWARKRNSVSSLAEGGFWCLQVHCLIQSAKGGDVLSDWAAVKRWSLLSAVRLSMKFNLSSRYVQAD